MNKLLVAAGVAGAAVALDQATKMLVRGAQEGETVYHTALVNIDHRENRGVIGGGHTSLVGGFRAASLIVAPALGYMIYRAGGRTPFSAAAAGLLIGAGLVNPIEGFVRGKVTDQIHIQGVNNWFNVADAMVVASIPLAFLAVATHNRWKFHP